MSQISLGQVAVCITHSMFSADSRAACMHACVGQSMTQANVSCWWICITTQAASAAVLTPGVLRVLSVCVGGV